jgi:hypothetical protein
VFVDATSDAEHDRASVVEQLTRVDSPVMDACIAIVVSDMCGAPSLTWQDISGALEDGNNAYDRFHPYAVPRP